MITIGKCLEIMHSGATFSLKVVTYDRRRKDRSGRINEYPEAVLMWAEAPDGTPSAESRPGERKLTELERRLAGGDDKIRRSPYHAGHYTRNIRLLMHGVPTEAVVKIHPPLIIEFNGQTTCP